MKDKLLSLTAGALGVTTMALMLPASSFAGVGCDVTCPDGSVQDIGVCDGEDIDPNGGCNTVGDPLDTHQGLGTLTPAAPITICGDVGGYSTGAPCVGDLNGSGTIDGADLGLLLGNWGGSGVGDLNNSGMVDGADLGLLLGAWGDCPPPGTDSRDLDWFTYSLDQPGTVTLSATHQAPDGNPSPIFTLFIRSGLDCAEQETLVAAASGDCPFELSAVLPSGDHVIILTVNDFGGGDPTFECPVSYVANLSVEYGQFPACGEAGSGSCIEDNGTPGCDDFECCEAVCVLNSFCCDVAWDALCADDAFTECGFFNYMCNADGNSPPNDCATTPQLVNIGDTVAFDTTNAQTDGPPQDECGSGAGNEQLDKDVWFRIDVTEDGQLVSSTCNLAPFDTKVAVYDLGTDPDNFDFFNLPAAFVGCNEDCAADAVFFSSELTSPIAAGHTYLVRVGGFSGAFGAGTLSLGFVPPPIFDTGGTQACVFNGNVTNLGWSSGHLSAGQPQRWSAQAFTLPARPPGPATEWNISEIVGRGFVAAGTPADMTLNFRIYSRTPGGGTGSAGDAPAPVADGDGGSDFIVGGQVAPLPDPFEDPTGNPGNEAWAIPTDFNLAPGDYWISIYAGRLSDPEAFGDNWAWFTNAQTADGQASGAVPNLDGGGNPFHWRSEMFPAPGYVFYQLDAATLSQADGLDPDFLYNAGFSLSGAPATP